MGTSCIDGEIPCPRVLTSSESNCFGFPEFVVLFQYTLFWDVSGPHSSLRTQSVKTMLRSSVGMIQMSDVRQEEAFVRSWMRSWQGFTSKLTLKVCVLMLLQRKNKGREDARFQVAVLRLRLTLALRKLRSRLAHRSNRPSKIFCGGQRLSPTA